MIRACSLENMDNQCGNFKFEGDVYKVNQIMMNMLSDHHHSCCGQGCILTCDYDGCNHGHTLITPLGWPLATLVASAIAGLASFNILL